MIVGLSFIFFLVFLDTCIISTVRNNAYYFSPTSCISDDATGYSQDYHCFPLPARSGMVWKLVSASCPFWKAFHYVSNLQLFQPLAGRFYTNFWYIVLHFFYVDVKTQRAFFLVELPHFPFYFRTWLTPLWNCQFFQYVDHCSSCGRDRVA